MLSETERRFAISVIVVGWLSLMSFKIPVIETVNLQIYVAVYLAKEGDAGSVLHSVFYDLSFCFPAGENIFRP